MLEAVTRPNSITELAITRFIESELPRLEALNETNDAAGDVEELNGFFRRYALAA